jgi:UDP-2,4-diacetamido-2,4,6-trideoxy-beta-L-altropyranose hydrolase
MARIAFRVDASAAMGQGHLSRCVALAARLRQAGATCHFVGGKTLQSWARLIESAGHALSLIDSAPHDPRGDAAQTRAALAGGLPVSWLVVDHYGLDARWHEHARPAARRLLALDDLANRPLAVNAVVDPSPCADEAGYRALTPAGCHLHLGPRYCLLRTEFADARSAQSWPSGGPRIHLAMGGTDPMEQTARMAAALLGWFDRIQVVAVLGGAGPQAEALAALQSRYADRLEVIVASDRVAATMQGCTCAIGAPGGTLWERFCMGLPTACVTTSPSQRQVVEKLGRAGWLLDLGGAGDFFRSARVPLQAWLQDRRTMQMQRELLMSQVDGHGAQRLATWMLEAA